MAENLNLKEFSEYLKESGILIVEDNVTLNSKATLTRKFKLISEDRVFYVKIWPNDVIETIIDLEDALLLYNLYK